MGGRGEERMEEKEEGWEGGRKEEGEGDGRTGRRRNMRGKEEGRRGREKEDGRVHGRGGVGRREKDK